MFRLFLIILLMSVFITIGCENKEAKTGGKPGNTEQVVTDSTDTSAVSEEDMIEPEDPVED